MKIRILLFTAVIATTALVSCGKKGLSEETKNKMTTFETDWKATGEAITAWGGTMNTTFAEMHTMMTEAKSMDVSKLKADLKPAVDSLNAVCDGIMGKMDMVKTTYEAAVANWATDEKAYTDWKAAGKDTPEEEVITGLDGYAAKLSEYKTNMETWNTMVTELQTNCKATCDAIKGIAGM